MDAARMVRGKQRRESSLALSVAVCHPGRQGKGRVMQFRATVGGVTVRLAPFLLVTELLQFACCCLLGAGGQGSMWAWWAAGARLVDARLRLSSQARPARPRPLRRAASAAPQGEARWDTAGLATAGSM